MVKETDIWNCSTGEFVGKGEFRQKIKVLGYISGTGIEMIFNGQICNESGCDNIRDQKINTPTLIVSGPILAADPSTTTNTEAATPAETTAQILILLKSLLPTIQNQTLTNPPTAVENRLPPKHSTAWPAKRKAKVSWVYSFLPF